MLRWTLLALLTLSLVVGTSPTWADEKEDEAKEQSAALKKQKDGAEAKLKAAKLKVGFGESDHLLVFAPLSDEKTAKLASTIQKTHNVAAKALKYDGNPWKGKLTVMLFAENRQFKSFLLDALKRPPQGRETTAMDLKGDAPTVLIGGGLGDKLTEATMGPEAAIQVAVALLNRKAGVGTSALTFSVPDWLGSSFGRVAYARADTTRLTTFRAKVKAAYNKTRGESFKAGTVWDAPPVADLDLIQSSFVDYLAYGPLNSKFVAFVQGFKPEDENSTPTTASVLTAMEWKAEDLEAGWKKWIQNPK